MFSSGDESDYIAQWKPTFKVIYLEAFVLVL
jgi:hypothetical protein